MYAVRRTTHGPAGGDRCSLAPGHIQWLYGAPLAVQRSLMPEVGAHLLDGSCQHHFRHARKRDRCSQKGSRNCGGCCDRCGHEVHRSGLKWRGGHARIAIGSRGSWHDGGLGECLPLGLPRPGERRPQLAQGRPLALRSAGPAVGAAVAPCRRRCRGWGLAWRATSTAGSESSLSLHGRTGPTSAVAAPERTLARHLRARGGRTGSWQAARGAAEEVPGW
eukprot:scaffold7583_cov64-Phaeocystis_antarctica.AAC.2